MMMMIMMRRRNIRLELLLDLKWKERVKECQRHMTSPALRVIVILAKYL